MTKDFNVNWKKIDISWQKEQNYTELVFINHYYAWKYIFDKINIKLKNKQCKESLSSIIFEMYSEHLEHSVSYNF